jgi:hypothetical protein
MRAAADVSADWRLVLKRRNAGIRADVQVWASGVSGLVWFN